MLPHAVSGTDHGAVMDQPALAASSSRVELSPALAIVSPTTNAVAPPIPSISHVTPSPAPLPPPSPRPTSPRPCAPHAAHAPRRRAARARRRHAPGRTPGRTLPSTARPHHRCATRACLVGKNKTKKNVSKFIRWRARFACLRKKIIRLSDLQQIRDSDLQQIRDSDLQQQIRDSINT